MQRRKENEFSHAAGRYSTTSFALGVAAPAGALAPRQRRFIQRGCKERDG